MRKWVCIAVAVLLVAIVGVVGWQASRPQEPEPVYQGKRLSVWLRDFQRTEQLTNAVRQIDTTAIPTLLKMLAKRDSPVFAKLAKLESLHDGSFLLWVRNSGWFGKRASALNREAELGFAILGTNAQQAVPALITFYERNTSPDSQLGTSRALNAIGPVAQRMAVPCYLRAATSSNALAHEVGVRSLSGVQVEPSKVIPVLIKSLGESNRRTRSAAANGLGGFGAEARRAVPALVPLLSDSDPFVRATATNALKAIDPEAAAKAGVK